MLKTFLVEDEVVIREMIKKMIPSEQYGFELAGEASDREMALPFISKGICSAFSIDSLIRLWA